MDFWARKDVSDQYTGLIFCFWSGPPELGLVTFFHMKYSPGVFFRAHSPGLGAPFQ
jgi:hypothetical protein